MASNRVLIAAFEAEGTGAGGDGQSFTLWHNISLGEGFYLTSWAISTASGKILKFSQGSVLPDSSGETLPMDILQCRQKNIFDIPQGMQGSKCVH